MQVSRMWAIAAACLFALTALPIASGQPGPPPTVAMSNVVVERNSLSGKIANLTWSTDPKSACDVFAYQVAGSGTWTTITLPCRVHAVSLSGLATHTTYAYTITSSARRYNPATSSGSFYPTDVSLSRAYEAYQYNVPITPSNCGTVNYRATITAEMPGDIEFDPNQAANPNHYEMFGVAMHFDGLGTTICPPLNWILAAQQTVMHLWVLDPTSGSTDWFAGGIPTPTVGGSGTTGSVTWTITFGVEHGAAVDVTMGYTPPTGVTVYPTLVNGPYPDGWLEIGRLEINWQSGTLQTIDDVVWPLHVIDNKAQSHRYDQVLVRVGFVTTLSIWDPNYGQWIGTVTQLGLPAIVLGQGFDNNGGTNLDQYTDVQTGTSSSPGT